MRRVRFQWSVRATVRTAAVVLTCLLCLGSTQIQALAAQGGKKADPSAEQMLNLMNRARHRRGVHRLHLDERLSRKVHRHSAQMARRHRLFHSRNVTRYLRGRHWRAWGENIGEVAGSLARLNHLFLHSAPHRKNLLNRGFHDAGVGVVQSKGDFWVTVVFYG